jgi:hypothetical protein
MEITNSYHPPAQENPFDPLTCKPESLRGHIAKTHLRLPRVISDLGVARWDIELAAYRGIPLDWVVKKAYQYLEEDDETIRQKIFAGNPRCLPLPEDSVFRRLDLDDKSPSLYRVYVVKNLIYVDQLGLASVDWDRVELAVVGARQVDLDIEKDSREGPFNLETDLFRLIEAMKVIESPKNLFIIDRPSSKIL